MKRVVLTISFLLALIFGSLFYGADINFQIERFVFENWVTEVLFFLIILIVSELIEYYYDNYFSKKKDS